MATDLAPNSFDKTKVKRDVTFSDTFKVINIAGVYLSGLQKVSAGQSIKIGGLTSYNKTICFYAGDENFISSDTITAAYTPILIPKSCELGTSDNVVFNATAEVVTPVFYQVSTYAAMIALGAVTVLTEVYVTTDENKGQTNTVYKLWPNGTRMWVACVKDN
jgi:hypothetical protein